MPFVYKGEGLAHPHNGPIVRVALGCVITTSSVAGHWVQGSAEHTGSERSQQLKDRGRKRKGSREVDKVRLMGLAGGD